MRFCQPIYPADLFQVFDGLTRGESIALAGDKEYPPAGFPTEIGPWLGVQSSGSTGRPKMIWRRWPDLLREVRASAQSAGWIWATPFRPASFAGVQVALQAYVTQGAIHALFGDWTRSWQQLIEQKVQAISCTPTFIDLLIQHEPESAGGYQPGQITLGGETLRPRLGLRLQQRFPRTRFTVIYAAAEYGVLLKTQRLDGWYERETLDRRYPQWRVSAEGELEVRKTGQWQKTGDRVEVQAGLMRVVGRCDDVANVAGSKINLSEIAALAETVPGIRRAIAVGEPNAIAGQIISLRFSTEAGEDVRVIQQRLEDQLRQKLPKAAWPRNWVLDEVGLGPNSKRAGIISKAT